MEGLLWGFCLELVIDLGCSSLWGQGYGCLERYFPTMGENWPTQCAQRSGQREGQSLCQVSIQSL